MDADVGDDEDRFPKKGGENYMDPGSQIGTALNTMFTGTLATGLSIVGIVIAGCLMLFGGGQGIRILGAALLGCVLILDAPTIIGWIQTVV